MFFNRSGSTYIAIRKPTGTEPIDEEKLKKLSPGLWKVFNDVKELSQKVFEREKQDSRHNGCNLGDSFSKNNKVKSDDDFPGH